MEMEIAKMTSKGQLTVPVAIRKKLRLKEGDKVVFIEDDRNGIRIVNASVLALEKIQAAFAGEAERLGLKDEQDVLALIRKVRAEANPKTYAYPD